ncbi:MAG TPA: adenosylcobalamin-dependent ribonucleoside-diphosphate reductase [Nitrospirota bacterium]|nr:adenosylcobalamin-dependent ribonucleoside-diphosphate reductase [Nitrospirota bacterium]
MAVKEIKLTENALKVLERRYLAKDAGGRVVETPEELFRRVARTIAEVDERYEPGSGRAREELYYDMMAGLEFLPNSPTLMNAGTRVGQFSACFVIPVGDSMREIFSAVSAMAEIHQSGGGTGFSFSRLRPRNDIVGSTGGIASGPVSFMKIYDQATEVIKQGGRRRGANMGILRVDHPDIVEFIEAKEKEGVLRNFNLSVSVPDAFMERLERDEEYPLINPRDGQEAGRLRAREVWARIAKSAWKTGDPGVVFIDRINAAQPTPAVGEIEATNPCGEQPLLPYESCNLGSINLKAVVRGGAVDWDGLRGLVRDGVQFLDGIIDANRYPLPEIAGMTHANRKVGLGVMGFAEMLVMLGIPYASEEALELAGRLMSSISEEAVRKSAELGRSRGSFPNFRGSRWEERGLDAMRNATVTTIAPTGTISIIAGASSGIEPLFAVAYVRRVLDGAELMEVNELFLERAKADGFYTGTLMDEIAGRGSLRDVPGVPDEVKRVFMTAFDIAPEWHVRMQAAFQKYTDNAVSKTINLPREATPGDVEDIYMLAYRLGCKGITVFRYGSKNEQVLSIEGLPGAKIEEGRLKLDAEFSGECKICSV